MDTTSRGTHRAVVPSALHCLFSFCSWLVKFDANLLQLAVSRCRWRHTHQVSLAPIQLIDFVLSCFPWQLRSVRLTLELRLSLTPIDDGRFPTGHLRSAHHPAVRLVVVEERLGIEAIVTKVRSVCCDLFQRWPLHRARLRFAYHVSHRDW